MREGDSDLVVEDDCAAENPSSANARGAKSAEETIYKRKAINPNVWREKSQLSLMFFSRNFFQRFSLIYIF